MDNIFSEIGNKISQLKVNFDNFGNKTLQDPVYNSTPSMIGGVDKPIEQRNEVISAPPISPAGEQLKKFIENGKKVKSFLLPEITEEDWNKAKPIFKEYPEGTRMLNGQLLSKDKGGKIKNIDILGAVGSLENVGKRAVQNIGENIINKIHPEDIKIMEDFIDYARIGKKIPDKIYNMAESLATKFKINLDKGLKSVANEFESVLTNKKKVPNTLIDNIDDNLFKEARKYKSAEEFVNAKFSEKPTYGMSHRPSYEGMPPAYNLLEGEILPRDVYTYPDFSISTGRIRSGDKAANENWVVIQKIKGNPDAEIIAYRAGAKNELNTGDWITFSKEYAKQSVEGTEKVHSFKIKAKDAIFAGDDINEFGYYPKSQLTDIWNKANGL